MVVLISDCGMLAGLPKHSELGGEQGFCSLAGSKRGVTSRSQAVGHIVH